MVKRINDHNITYSLFISITYQVYKAFCDSKGKYLAAKVVLDLTPKVCNSAKYI